MGGLAVIAFGGNALIGAGEDGTEAEQRRNARNLARALVPLMRQERGLVVVHGNGPQVGNLAIRMEEAVTKIPPLPLDYCVAQSQGEIGYLLELAIANAARAAGLDRRVASLLTRVRVQADDVAFVQPTKPIGPFLTRYRANLLRRERRVAVVEDAGRGYRQVVASPRPVEVIGLPAIRTLLESGAVVIAGGGGGIPVVVRRGGRLEGVEAVIDKDYTAGSIAAELGADTLIILTDVEQVFAGYGTSAQRGLGALELAEARRLLEDGEFPAGSMGPKVETAVEFVDRTGGIAIVTRAEKLAAAFAGRAGTRFVPDRRGNTARAGRPRVGRKK